ncbi:hypothetical protein SAMN04488574_105111 [Bacillus sp. 71mf]|nr:hypothetical protein SAMN04488574_105111 [Bacillus sp. 71mf]SFS65773.1 hypothetical protein SAMN04488145_102207 [Bacillus sp. 103mf]
MKLCIEREVILRGQIIHVSHETAQQKRIVPSLMKFLLI